MFRRILIVALLLPFSALALAGHARADSITPGLLTDALLTRGELNAVLDAVNINAAFSSISDLNPQTGDRVGVCRIYATGAGYAAGICLFANADGTPTDSSLQNTILSGDALQNVAVNTGLFDTIGNVALQGGTGLADADQLATFTAVSSGVNLNVISDVFIKGIVAGYVYFASVGTPDPGTMGGILGVQIAKLS